MSREFCDCGYPFVCDVSLPDKVCFMCRLPKRSW